MKNPRKRMFAAAVFTLALAAAVFAQAKPTLAILPFTGGEGEDGETIAELFSFDPTLAGVFAPIPRTSINTAVSREQNFQMSSGMTDPDTISRIGHQLGARYVVAGSITSLGSQRLLVISIIQIEKLQQIAGDWQTYGDLGEMQDKLPQMARNIVEAYRRDTSRLRRLAVLPFQTPRGDREADALAQMLAAEIVRSGAYAVFPRTKTLEQVQEEYRNQYNGDTADEEAVALGRGENPLLALSGAVRSLGQSRRMFNAAVINVESGVQEQGDTANFNTIEEGVAAIRTLASKLTGVMVSTEYRAGNAEAFMEAVNTINRQGAGNYTIILTGNIFFEPRQQIRFVTNAQKTISIRGDDRVRSITGGDDRMLPLLDVPSGITLVLAGNLRLSISETKIIDVLEGGTLRMEAGVTITGSSKWCGVYVYNGATFVMNGGTVSGNMAGVVVDRGTFTMNGGTISGNRPGVGVSISGTFSMNGGTISNNNGGGVSVSPNGVFTMIGGTISGNTASGKSPSGRGGGVCADRDGVFVKTGGTIEGNRASNQGNQVFTGTSRDYRVRNSTAGPSVRMDNRVAGSAGGWE